MSMFSNKMAHIVLPITLMGGATVPQVIRDAMRLGKKLEVRIEFEHSMLEGYRFIVDYELSFDANWASFMRLWESVNKKTFPHREFPNESEDKNIWE